MLPFFYCWQIMPLLSPIYSTGNVRSTVNPKTLLMRYFLQLKAILVLGLFALSTITVDAQLMSWQFGSPESLGSEASYAATYVDPHITSVPLTRGAGLTASALARGFSSNNFVVNGTKTDAINNGDYYQVGLTVQAGCTVSLYNIDTHLRRSSTAAINAYRWMYSINGGSFIAIGTADISYTGTTTDGDDQTPVILSGISDLQNLTAGTSVTLRLYLWGATTTTSTLAIGRYATANTSPSLAIGGRVTPTGTSSLLGWQFGSPASAGYEAIYPSTTTATGLTASTLSRGAGIPGDPTIGLTRGFTADNFTPINSVKSDAIANGNYYQFTVTPATGYSASLSTLDARIRRTSAAANSYRWMYSLDGTNFTAISSADVTFMSTFDGTDQPQIDLSSITALQQIPAGTTVTFRIYAWGNTTLTGTFAIGRYNVSGTTINSLEVQGKINASAASDYYRSKQTGNWQTFTTWESSPDNVNWISATTTPTNAATNIDVKSGHTVTSTTNLSLANTSVEGSLVIATGTSMAIPSGKTLSITGTVLLQSDATGTASIAASQGTITGEVTAQRYCNNERAYRFIAPGVTTSTSIYANWQNGGANIPNMGTQITGDVNGTNGFDATITGASSLFAFDNTAQAWNAFGIAQPAPFNNTSSHLLKAGEAYRLFVRGDRSIDLSNNASAGQTILLTKGAPYIGNYTFSNSSTPVALSNTANNWNFIGNPYLSEVDWGSGSLTRTNLSSAFYIWDLSLGTRGAYAYFDAADNTSTGGATQYIQPGEAFFVQTTGASPLLQFTENAKSNGHNNTTTFGAQDNIGLLSVKLLYNNDTGKTIVADQANTVFNKNAQKGKDNLDIEKFTNLDENIAFAIDSSVLIKNAYPVIEDTASLQLSLWQLQKRNYALSIKTSGIDYDTLYLEDKYLQTFTRLAVNAESVVSFEVNDNAASSAKDRFRIVLYKTTVTVVPPVVLNIFNASLLGTMIDNELRILVTPKSAGTINIKVVNSLGQIVATKKIASPGMQESVSIPSGAFQPGVYFIEVSSGNEKVVLKGIKN